MEWSQSSLLIIIPATPSNSSVSQFRLGRACWITLPLLVTPTVARRPGAPGAGWIFQLRWIYGWYGSWKQTCADRFNGHFLMAVSVILKWFWKYHISELDPKMIVKLQQLGYSRRFNLRIDDTVWCCSNTFKFRSFSSVKFNVWSKND